MSKIWSPGGYAKDVVFIPGYRDGQGGGAPAISYGSYLGNAVQNLYREAVAAAEALPYGHDL